MGIVARITAYAREHYDQDEYNWFHNEFVTKTALQLGKGVGADLEILELASRLHDIDYSRGPKHHVIDSAKKAEELLIGFGYPPEKVAQVKTAILCHSSKTISDIKNPSVEGKILFDADHMWKMTPKGFARLIAHRYRKNTSYAFIVEQLTKALRNYERLHFDESRAMVKDDFRICNEFLRQL